jgi:hypothetical protein
MFANPPKWKDFATFHGAAVFDMIPLRRHFFCLAQFVDEGARGKLGRNHGEYMQLKIPRYGYGSSFEAFKSTSIMLYFKSFSVSIPEL